MSFYTKIILYTTDTGTKQINQAFSQQNLTESTKHWINNEDPYSNCHVFEWNEYMAFKKQRLLLENLLHKFDEDIPWQMIRINHLSEDSPVIRHNWKGYGLYEHLYQKSEYEPDFLAQVNNIVNHKENYYELLF